MGAREGNRPRPASATKPIDAGAIDELVQRSAVDPDDKQTREMDPAMFRALLREGRGGATTPPVPEPVVEQPRVEPIEIETPTAPVLVEPWLAQAMDPPAEEPREPISYRLVAALVLAIIAAVAIVLLR